MNLGDWRSRIDDLDDRVLNLLNQRAEAALPIGDLQRRQDAPSSVPGRGARMVIAPLARAATLTPRAALSRFGSPIQDRPVRAIVDVAEAGARPMLPRVSGTRPAA